MSKNSPKSESDSIIEEGWSHIVGGMSWLKSVFFGEFADNRPLSAVIADMLVSFLPGVVIVTSARDAVAVVLRLANHPEKREELMEWILLCACLITIALPLAMAAGGAAAAGVGAIIGGIAGSELAAALRGVMLMLIKKASALVDLVLFLQKFIKGDVLKFLRAVKFVQYEKPLLQALSKIVGKLAGIVRSLRQHLESLQYFDSVKASIAKLAEWERKFYNVQQDALRQIPRALAELDSRLAQVLKETAPKETHLVVTGVQTIKSVTPPPTRVRIKDTPGKIFAKVEDDAAVEASSKGQRSTKSKPTKKHNIGPTEHVSNSEPPPDKGPNTRKQEAKDASALATQEKVDKIVDKVGSDIKNHPLRQAYEMEVAGLKEEAEIMKKAGVNGEEVARKMWERRREIGVKYKNLTPEPLRDYIYEVNSERYKDPLGPSFESLIKSAEKKMVEPYSTIIESSARPNSDVNGLLSKFGEWLARKDAAYLDKAIK